MTLTRDEVRKKIPSEFIQLYQFNGLVHPLRNKAVLPDMGLVRVTFVFAKYQLPACLYVTSGDGKFCADLYVTKKIEDLASVRNALSRHINLYLDLSCFYDGFPYECEIESCITPLGEQLDLGLYSNGIKEEASKYQKRVAKEKLTTHKCFPFLGFALKDFRRAIQDPNDTYALVYRAIESIRNYYGEINGLDTSIDSERKKSWEILRETLGYKREDFKFLEDHAASRRHGQVTYFDADELEKCRVFGWSFLIRFIEHTFGSDCIIPP